MSNQGNEEKFSIEKFWEKFISTDQDDVYNCLFDLLEHCHEINYLKEFEKNGETRLTSIINQILGDPKYLIKPDLRTIFDVFMQLIPQLAAKLPINLLPVLYEYLLAHNAREGIGFFTNLSNVLISTITNASNYTLDRQQEITKIMMNRLFTYINKDDTKEEMKNLCLNLLALTVENLPNCLAPNMITEIRALIEKLCKKLCEKDVNHESNSYITNSNLVATLSKVYSTLIKDKEQTDFFDYIEKLEYKRLGVYILAIIIEYRPQYFDLSEEKSNEHAFTRYQDLIFEQIKDPAQEVSNAYATFIVQCLNTLSILITKFSNKMTEDQISAFISAVFDYLNLGTSQVEEVEEAEDIQFETQIDDDNDDANEPDPEEIDNVDNSDDSWKIREAAMKFAISLIEEQGDLFYNSLFYVDDESYMPKFVTNLIRDSDLGSKLESMNFLRVIIHHYKTDIDPAIIDDFEQSLISQIRKEAPNQVLDSFIRTLTFMIHDMNLAPSLELSLDAINRITEVYRDNTTDATLLFITNLLEFSTDTEIIQPIISLINIILKAAKPHMKVICLTVVSRIYHYYYRICKNEASVKKDLNSLNEVVLGLSKAHGEIKLYAINTISVFVACCPGLETAQKSADLIVSLLDDNSTAKASISAIALISASEASNTLSKDIKSILTKLKTKINSEPILTYRSLWTITIMLSKGIVTTNDCQDIVGTLFEIASKGDMNARDLSLKIINKIYPNGCDSNRLCSLVDSLTSSPLNERFISEISELVLASSKASLDNVKPFVDSLINKVQQNQLGKDESASQLIVSNLASIIGIASSTNKDFGLSLISKFKSNVNDKGISQVFALKCIGEIGSLIDISSTNGDLVDSIFKLVHDEDRNVFIPASESIGLMSVGSPTIILTKFMDAAKSDGEKFLTAYLFGIKSFVKKASTIKNHIPKGTFDEIKKKIPIISDYLLANANDDFKETALTVSECLSGIVGISFDYSKKLIDVATYITIRAIAIYMEEYSSYSYKTNRPMNDKEKEEVLSLIGEVNAKYDVEKPMLNYAIMLCIKFGLTKKLAKELLEAGYMDQCLTGTEIQQSHNLIQTIGIEQVAINIGTPLKSTSLTCIELFIKSDVADQLNYDDLSRTILTSFSTETLYELRQKALDIMTMVAKLPFEDAKDSAITTLEEATSVDFLKRFDNVVSNDHPPNDVIVSYYNTLVTLLGVAIPGSEDERKIKNILARHQSDPLLVRIEEENQFKGSGSSDSIYFTSGYTSSKLMEQFYPEAASIFFN